ncbi:MAG: class I SAM-dependent methyltransferase [Candidatus Omnitrophica bacterium]|nr:class I SAM-dependent methyltransferase [Candidatus Omnitrophota bacterium]
MDMLNLSGLAFMMSIGHRTGLFDVLADLPPSTSVEIAAKAKLNERYVREWLGAMLTGGVVVYDPATKKYSLPVEHSSMLTRSAGADNIAALAQYFAVLGSVEDRVVESFEKGGGVDYSEYKRFQEVMAADSGQSVVPALVDSILPLVPGLIERLEEGIEVMDLGFGRGIALNMMAKRFPNSRFTGYEISDEGIEYARAEAEALGNKNVQFLKQDAATIADENRFDQIFTFDAIHDQAQPDKVLANICRALKPGGVYLMQDIDASSNVEKNVDHPLGTLLYSISTMHCMTVSLAMGGMGLGTMWGVELAQKMLAEAGFKSVDIKRLPHDIQNCFYICRK